MIALIQRVREASVSVKSTEIAAIDSGILALIGIEKHDTWQDAEKLAGKLLSYRIFSDENGKMNHNIKQVNGSILLVSQFTLAANTRKGNRPGFDSAMPPDEARVFFMRFYEHMCRLHPTVSRGEFGADMQVTSTNDGPVTFWLQTGDKGTT